MHIISKSIPHEELDYIAIIVSYLATAIIANNNLEDVLETYYSTSTVKWKRVDVDYIFEKLGSIYSHGICF